MDNRWALAVIEVIHNRDSAGRLMLSAIAIMNNRLAIAVFEVIEVNSWLIFNTY